MRSRRKRPPFLLIGGGVVLAALIGAVFWFANVAEQNRPEPRDIRVEAQNVGPR